MKLSRRNLFKWTPALALAPVVAKLAPAAEEATTFVRYGGAGHLYNAVYIHKTYGIEVGPVNDYTAQLIESMLDSYWNHAANVLNGNVFGDYDNLVG